MSLGFEERQVGGIRLHVLPTDRFKTHSITVFIGRELQEKTVTPTALTPFVLRRGNMSFPETKQFREQLDNLYGAGFGFDITKRGDYQIAVFRMDIVDERYVSEKQSLLRDGIRFIGETLSQPALEQGMFRKKYVDSEKTTLKKQIESVINDKIRYAAERCVEEMCKDEPYRLHPLGKIDEIAQLTAAALYEQYQVWLAEAPIDIYVVGNTSADELAGWIQQSFQIERKPALDYHLNPLTHNVSEVKHVVDRLDVKQGKLNMGLRTHLLYTDEAYPAALMYNGILGSYPHSKLFTNVREKASLAYYAASRLDAYKGIMTIQSGIEIENAEKATAIIKEQLEAMAQGQINETELSQTRAMISNQLRTIQDGAFEMISYDFNRVLSGKDRTISDMIGRIQEVTVEDIVKVAQQVELDTIYFLRDKKGESQ